MPPTVTPPTPRMESMNPAPITHEEILDENYFHEVVNQDQEMYDAIDAVPIGSDDMIGSIVAVVQHHVSEVWSQPRVTKLAHKHGLSPGMAYDIETNDEPGMPWDFDQLEQRNKCMRKIIEQKPAFLIGSPMCKAFSILQGLNRAKMDPAMWDALWNNTE